MVYRHRFDLELTEHRDISILVHIMKCSKLNRLYEYSVELQDSKQWTGKDDEGSCHPSHDSWPLDQATNTVFPKYEGSMPIIQS
jgi:hypothetical protein